MTDAAFPAIRQAVVLAGGTGMRLRPFTDDQPKPMYPFEGKPFLQYLLEQVRSFGIEEVVLLLGYLPESWSGWVTLVVTICAALSAVWPRPSDSASPVLRLLYTVVNAVGFNAGKAKNADDAAAKAMKL